MAEPDTSNIAVKAADSLYSNSYNSESNRSLSCKSALRSGSNSSGSSGYGGNPSSGSSGGSKSHAKRNKEKESKKENTKVEPESQIIEEKEQEETNSSEVEKGFAVPAPELNFTDTSPGTEAQKNTSEQTQRNKDDFSCVVSMQNGIIMYSTATLRNILGYPQEMWVGRSFIDFVHPKDQGMFASQISNIEESSPCLHAKESELHPRVSLYCRLRRYNGLSSAGFGIKTNTVSYIPSKLVLSFYDQVKEFEKAAEPIENNNLFDMNIEFQGVYIVIQATAIVSAFKEPLEIIYKGATFNMRHSVLGVIEHIDASSIPYLGYMPHDLVGACAIKMYHPEDLCYMRRIYETVVKLGQAPKSRFRILTQSGNYIRVGTKFTCFVNPWSKKLEYVTGHHEVIQGPCDIDVFGPPDAERSLLTIKKVRMNADIMRDQILRIMNECLTKRAEVAKHLMTRKCQNISTIMEKYMERSDQERMDWTGKESLSEKGSVLLGGISPHHDYYDSNSGSTDTSPSYNQMNYKGILQKFFDSEPITHTTISDDAPQDSNKSRQSGANGFVAMESDEDDLARVPLNNSKDRHRHRLTEAALKKHNQEMEIVLAKEIRENRYRPEKKTLSRQRLEHLARCNERNDKTMSAAVFAHPKHYFRHGGKSASKNALKRDRSKRNGLGCQREPTTSRRDNSESKRVQESKHAKRESPGHKQGVKRDVTSAAMLDSTRPQKQIKQTLNGQSRYSPLTAMAFDTTNELRIMGSMMGISMRTNTFVDTISPSMGRQTKLAAYSPASMPPVWSNQNNAFTSSTVTSTPHMSPVYGGTNRCIITTGSSLSLMPGAMRSTGVFPMLYVPEPTNPRIYKNSNIVPIMLYPHVHGQPIVYAPVHSAALYPKPATKATNNQGRNQGSDDSSWNPSINNEPNSGSDQEVMDKTEGETSSSFYSSFLKLDSSGEDQGVSSSDKDSATRSRKKCMIWVQGQNKYADGKGSSDVHHSDGHINRKLKNQKNVGPPWMREVLATSDLFFRYQVPQKCVEETLDKDKIFLANSNQSEEVNNQLNQLYLDLNLLGVTSRLTLEEGITSSGSSEEETTPQRSDGKKRRPYSKVAMMFEEDAAFPPPESSLMNTSHLGDENSLSTANKNITEKTQTIDASTEKIAETLFENTTSDFRKDYLDIPQSSSLFQAQL